MQSALSQAAIPLTLALSVTCLGARISRTMLLGALIIFAGVALELAPSILAGDPSSSAGGTGTNSNWAVVFIAAQAPAALCSIYQEHVFSSKGVTVNVKYIDPSYMIRSVPANASDSLFCMLLAQNAVHGAMAGYTCFTTGLCCNRTVFLPIPALVENSPRRMDKGGRTWERIISVTGQPNRPVDPASKAAADSAVNPRTIF